MSAAAPAVSAPLASAPLASAPLASAPLLVSETAPAAPRWILAVLIALYTALTLLLIARVPLGQTPDEFAHFQYVEYIAVRGKLPVFEPLGAPNPGYEFHQPPLYYALCAPLWNATGAGVQNYGCRLVSLLCGAATLWFLWHAAAALFPRERELPILATGFAALWPLHGSVGASSGNDALAGLICAAVFWQVARGATRPWTLRDSLCCGVLVGLGLLTKTTCLVMGVVAAGAAWSFAKSAHDASSRMNENSAMNGGSATHDEGKTTKLRPDSQHPASPAQRAPVLHPASVAGAALLVGGWWLARNQHLYGDPLAQAIFNQAFRFKPQTGLGSPGLADFLAGGVSVLTYFQALLISVFGTAWGIFGGPENARRFWNPFTGVLKREAMPALLPMLICALATLGALWGVTRATLRRRAAGTHIEPASRRSALIWWSVGLTLVLLAWARFSVEYFAAAQARYFHPALLPLALGFALGWKRLLGGRALWVGAACFGATLLGLTLWNVFVWRTLV